MGKATSVTTLVLVALAITPFSANPAELQAETPCDAKTPCIAATPPIEKPAWILTFNDEFNGYALDASKWLPRYGGHPAVYEMRDGILHLRVDEDTPGLNEEGGACSGIATYDRVPESPVQDFAQQYGRFEIRARVPSGNGLCSTFWMKPLDPMYKRLEADGGTRASADHAMEIDIFEQLGKDPCRNKFTVHFGRDYKENHRFESHYRLFPFDLSKNFHVYALEWDEKYVVWFVDGAEAFRSDKPAHEPFAIILSLYAGTNWWGELDLKLEWPKDYEIDYIRVYKKAPEHKKPDAAG